MIRYPVSGLVLISVLLGTVGLALSSGPPTGTFSIVAYDPETQELGVAVQSRAFNVGAGVAWARAGVGAIATQAYTNESFGPNGLALLAEGKSSMEALRELLNGDEGRESRQVGIIDVTGVAATYTGKECSYWAGGRSGKYVAAQGNILAGEEVVMGMMSAFRETRGELSLRLIAALKAGQAAGGDKRGQQSAALLVVRPSKKYPEYEERYVSLRVDDHESPIDELERIYRLHEATDLAEAHLRYAELYRELGDQEAADRELRRVGETLKRALADKGASSGMLNGLAWYTCTNDMFLDESLAAAKRASEMEPESTEILDTLAECHFRRGELGDAIRVVDRALELSPGDPYLTAQKKKFEEAKTGTR